MKNKNIVIGVTGGIAAYKAAALVSMLKKAGAKVHVCMTKSACEFVAPLTFETLSNNKVITDLFQRETPYEVEHVALAKLADVLVIAPATANIIGKAASGIADDFLSTLILATDSKKVVFAPAMNTNILNHPAVQKNIQTLMDWGYRFISSEAGLLACGDVGDGRMAEPEHIAAWLEGALSEREKDLAGKKFLVTAGPTREKIDDVRYITNRSTGKMGYQIALAAARRGAEVTLVSGSDTEIYEPGVRLIKTVSAEEMYQACMDCFEDVDVVVKAAAVADYTPRQYVPGKIKKSGDMALELVRTKDILKEMGARKKNQILVGFAAEAEELEKYATAKLAAKNLDVIAANDISRSDIGFGSDENLVTLYFKEGGKKVLTKADKLTIAHELLDEVKKLLK